MILGLNETFFDENEILPRPFPGAFHCPHHRKSRPMLQIFSVPDDPSLLTFGVYEPRFVLLSVLIAIF